jgi:hypothetical protein
MTNTIRYPDGYVAIASGPEQAAGRVEERGPVMSARDETIADGDDLAHKLTSTIQEYAVRERDGMQVGSLTVTWLVPVNLPPARTYVVIAMDSAFEAELQGAVDSLLFSKAPPKAGELEAAIQELRARHGADKSVPSSEPDSTLRVSVRGELDQIEI